MERLSPGEVTKNVIAITKPTENYLFPKQEMLKDPNVKAEYERLEPEFCHASMLIEAGSKAGLSQEALAERMGMKQASVARLESGRNNPQKGLWLMKPASVIHKAVRR